GRERRLEPGQRRVRDPPAVEPRGSALRRKRPRLLVRELQEVGWQRDVQALGVADVEGSGRVGATQPFLAGDRVEVEPRRVHGDRAGRLRAVDEDRYPDRLLKLLDREQVAG